MTASAVALLSAALVQPLDAGATFPGANGKIAVSSNRTGNFEIYTINQDGSGDTNITNNGATDFQAAWSPDGTKIAFQSNRDGNFEIYVMNADGSGLTRLTNDPGNDASPAWSPSGTSITFSSTRDGNPEIYAMNADGSSPTRLTDNPALDIIPRWSPDNSKIAYTSNRDGNFEVYSMNIDGSGQTNLSQNSASDFASSWYPNGSRLAFSSNRDGNSNVYTMHPDGSGQTRITDDPADDTDPAFSPDGSEITFDSDRGGSLGVWRIELSLPLSRVAARSDPATPVEDDPSGDDSGGGESGQPVQVPPNIEITKTAKVREAAPRERIDWTITVRNLGGFVTDVTVGDHLDLEMNPVGTPFGDASCGDWNPSIGNFSWATECDLGDLAQGEVRVIHVSSKVIRHPEPGESATNSVELFIGGNRIDGVGDTVKITCGEAGQKAPIAFGDVLRSRGLSAAAASIRGTGGSDLVCGTRQGDVLDGRGGNDRIYGLGGDDVLIGGGGKDKLVGGPGDDQCSQGGRSGLKPCK